MHPFTFVPPNAIPKPRRLATLALAIAAIAWAGCTEPTRTDDADRPAASGEPATDLEARTRQFAKEHPVEPEWLPADANAGDGAQGRAVTRDDGAIEPVRIVANPRRTVTTQHAGQPPRVESTPPTTAVESAPTPPDQGASGRDRSAADARPQPAPPMDTQALVDALRRRLADADESGNAGLRPYLARAALSAIDPAHGLTEADLAALSTDQRRLVLAYQRVFSQMGRGLGRDVRADRQLLEDLAMELADQAAAAQPLTIRNVKLCRRVTGFGQYQAFDRSVFLARRSHPVIVYAELDHYQTDVESDGRRVARLTQELTLYNDADGLPVWRQRPVEIVDRSFNRRRDFFIVQVVNLSDRLTVGKYLLKVTITDQIGNAVDEASVPIQIVADPSAMGD